MRISSLEIENTFGVSDFKVSNFTVVRLVGANGVGKSSVIRALSYLFAGGCDPSVVKRGAEQSVVRMGLNDGTMCVKTTRPKRSRKGGEITGWVADLEITAPDASVVNAPQSYLASLGSAIAVDPATLLKIDATSAGGRRALAAELMKLVPLSFAPEEVNRACIYRSSVDIPRGEEDAIALPVSPEAPLSLDELKKTVAAITEQRRRLGITRDDTDGAINRLQKSLPPQNGNEDYSAKVTELELQLADIERKAGERRTEVATQGQEAIGESQRRHDAECAAADREYGEELARIEERRRNRRTAAKDALMTSKDAIHKLCQEELVAVYEAARPDRDSIRANLTAAKTAMEAHSRAATLRQEIELQLASHRAASWQYDQLSLVLQNLEVLRLEKLNHLPVAGLVVDDGVPYLDGIPWENCNTARKVEAVIQICCLQSGKLPLILWDDAEHGDSSTRAAIEEGLRKAGYQLVCAAVSDQSGLTIEVMQ